MKTFSTFSACVNAIVSEEWKPEDTEGVDLIMALSAKPSFNDVVKFNAYMDEKHDCSGYCYAPLFGYTTPITSGRPTNTC